MLNLLLMIITRFVVGVVVSPSSISHQVECHSDVLFPKNHNFGLVGV